MFFGLQVKEELKSNYLWFYLLFYIFILSFIPIKMYLEYAFLLCGFVSLVHHVPLTTWSCSPLRPETCLLWRLKLRSDAVVWTLVLQLLESKQTQHKYHLHKPTLNLRQTKNLRTGIFYLISLSFLSKCILRRQFYHSHSGGRTTLHFKSFTGMNFWQLKLG